jgi:hypothetical protein
MDALGGWGATNLENAVTLQLKTVAYWLPAKAMDTSNTLNIMDHAVAAAGKTVHLVSL